MAKRKQTLIQKIKMFIEMILLLPIIYIISWICPYKKIYHFSKIVGKYLLKINPNKKKIILSNLIIITPDKVYSQKELEELTNIIAGYELRIFLEMIKFSRMNFQMLISYIRIKSPQPLSYLYAEEHKGAIAVTLHYGNWELLGCFLNHIGFPMACLVERQFNPFIDRYLQRLRKKLGIKTIYNEISHMKELFYYHKKGGAIALVADQTYWFDPLFIPFFQKEVAVPQGIGNLVLRWKSSLFYGYTQYINEGIYLIDILSPISYQKMGDKNENIKILMKKIYKMYEYTIIKDLSNWYTLGQARWELTKKGLIEWQKNPDSSPF